MGMIQTWEPSLNCLKRWTTPETHQKNGITSLTDGQKGCFWWKIPSVVDKIMHASVSKPGTCKSYWKGNESWWKLGMRKHRAKLPQCHPICLTFAHPQAHPPTSFLGFPGVPKECESSPRMQVNAIGFIRTCSHSALVIVGLCNDCSNGWALSKCFRLKILHFIW